mgnify:CR=1 FL=1
MKLKAEEKELLLKTARDAIKARFRNEKVSPPASGIFDEELGVFVTLKELGRLQGCCGFPYPIYPLGKAVVEAALTAAFRDPRFPPLQPEQLPRISLDVSVLTEPELLAADDRDEYPGLIRIGIDGLLLRYKSRSGLLLPVVATEYGMDGKRFLEALCHKAGLPPDTWRENDCDIFTFQAIVISE